MIFTAHNSYFNYDHNYGFMVNIIINDYYKMIVEIIKVFLYNNPKININISLCNDYNFNNNNKTIKININWEHTLVKKGGRNVYENIFGDIDDDDYNKYLVRIDRYDELNKSDIIIDYSIPNIHNVKSCDLFSCFSNKHIYITPSIYDSCFIKENRNITLLTTFVNINEPRRHNLLNEITNKNLDHININNCFEKEPLKKLYKNTKIIINIHQTPQHHTFEELRALPALQCGVIVISEYSPLSNLIPYNNFVIWSSYDNILEKAIEVINNYDFFYDMIFVKENINKLREFNNINYDTLNDCIISKTQNKLCS